MQSLVEHLHGLGLGAQARIGKFQNSEHSHEYRVDAAQSQDRNGDAANRIGGMRENSTPIRHLARIRGPLLCPDAHFTPCGRLRPVNISYTLTKSLGESGNWRPCLKNYLQFAPGCCLPSRHSPRRCSSNKNHPDTYTVRKGDTLWSISARFLQRPWEWPEVWQANPQVANPHLIYPGEVLSLAYLNGQLRVTGDGGFGPHVRATHSKTRSSRSRCLRSRLPQGYAHTQRRRVQACAARRRD